MTNKLLKRVRELKKVTGQENYVLCSHPAENSPWIRHPAQEVKEDTHYNHRTIFRDEIVIEYDDEDLNKNYDYAQRTSKKLTQHNIPHSTWYSGNKSYHVHLVLDLQPYDDKHIRTVKETIMKYYGEHNIKRNGVITPDLNLAVQNHMIRAEHGIHEYTQKHKTIIDEDYKYPELTSLPKPVNKAVYKALRKAKKYIEKAQNNKEIDTTHIQKQPLYKYLRNPENMKRVGDGKKRFLFVLVNQLRQNGKTYEDTLQEVKDWYYQAGGEEYTPEQIKSHVQHSYNNNYTPGKKYLESLKEDIQIEQKIS